MTAVFYDNEEPQLIKLELVESIRTGYKQYKMIHLLEQPGGAQFKLPKEQLYWIVKCRGTEDLYLPMNKFSLEGIGK